MRSATGHYGLTLGMIVPFMLGALALADSGKGIGPVKDVSLEKIDVALVARGKKVFTAKCSACHKSEERYVGPALRGVTQRRKPEWIMNMILNPAQMLEEDETAKGLLGEFMVPMTFQNISQEEARAVLEYLREIDGKPAAPSKKKK